MYRIEFYEQEDGKSELWEFLEEMRIKSDFSKDARIQYKQMVLYIQLLSEKGTRMPDNITKHIEDGIWELRPGSNRVFYFSLRRTHSCCCITSERNLKKRRKERSTELNPKENIICSERRQ